MSKLKIRIDGKNPKYFLRELIKLNINIYELEVINNYLEIIVSEEDYNKIKKIKTTYKISIIDYYGVIKIQNIINRGRYYIIFIVLGIILNIILSQMIFKVEVEHSNQLLVNRLLVDLEELGIKKYHFKVNYDKREKIKNKILEKDRDYIEWLEIDEVGTTYKIRVEERKKNKKEKECGNRNIVSKKKAIITRIEADNGEVIKHIHDYVDVGDTIISGFIYNKEEVVSKKCAIGKVYGEVWYTVKVKLPLKRIVNKIDNKKHKGLLIELGLFRKEFRKPLGKYKKTEYNIIDSSILPIKIGVIDYQKVITKSKYYSNKVLINKAMGVAVNKIKNKGKILEKKVLKKNGNNSKIEVVIFFKVEEDITDYFDISDIKIEDINKKEE